MSRVVGGAQTLSKMRSRFPGAYPAGIKWALPSGARVRATDDANYIDWICALGAISLGYHDLDVDQAVRRQVERGPIFSLPDVKLEERVAEQLHALIPCAEAVRYLKTGSEATEAAIRTARAHTGREVVLVCGYHSWHSWYAATREHSPGVPQAMKGLVRTFRYNDLGSLDEAIDWAEGPQAWVEGGRIKQSVASTGGVAAIIMEPTLFEAPAPGFLEGVRERATRIGAVLIFDEMVTGFRWHAGGYQALCGVTPDLATFGKGMGNGYPIAALVGRAEVMRHAVLASGTFGGDCVGLAAASAVMERYAQRPLSVPILHPPYTKALWHDDVTGHMWITGRILMDRYNTLAKVCGAPTRMEGQPPHPRIVWDEVEEGPFGLSGHIAITPKKNRHRASLFFQECARRGVLFHPDGLNVSLAHGHAELGETLRACREAMEVTVTAIKNGTVRSQIEGDPISPVPPWRATQ